MTPVSADAMPWEWVRAGLQQIIDKTGEEWRPEDIYLALKTGQAFLFVLGQEDGFVVVQRQQYHYGPALFVWAIWGDLAHIQEQVEAGLTDLAKSIGAKRIRHYSNRRGWAREGYTEKGRIYERAV